MFIAVLILALNFDLNENLLSNQAWALYDRSRLNNLLDMIIAVQSD